MTYRSRGRSIIEVVLVSYEDGRSTVEWYMRLVPYVLFRKMSCINFVSCTWLTTFAFLYTTPNAITLGRLLCRVLGGLHYCLVHWQLLSSQTSTRTTATKTAGKIGSLQQCSCLGTGTHVCNRCQLLGFLRGTGSRRGWYRWRPSLMRKRKKRTVGERQRRGIVDGASVDWNQKIAWDGCHAKTTGLTVTSFFGRAPLPLLILLLARIVRSFMGKPILAGGKNNVLI